MTDFIFNALQLAVFIIAFLVYGLIISYSFNKLQSRLDSISINFTLWKEHVDKKIFEHDQKISDTEKKILSMQLSDEYRDGFKFGKGLSKQ